MLPSKLFSLYIKNKIKGNYYLTKNSFISFQLKSMRELPFCATKAKEFS